MSCREFSDRDLEKRPFPAWLRFCNVVTCQQKSRISYFRKSSWNFETFPISLFKSKKQLFRGKSFKNSNLSSQIPARRFIAVSDWCRIRNNPTFQNCLLSLRQGVNFTTRYFNRQFSGKKIFQKFDNYELLSSISLTFYMQLLKAQIPKVQKKTDGLKVFSCAFGT
jgi:hypothetical protein